MKKIHILGLVLIAGAIGALITLMGDISTYDSVASARKKEGKFVHLIAKIDTTQPIIYDPIKDPNYLTFTAIDSLGGLQYTAIEDIDYLKNKMFAALKIPKAYLGYDENVNGKATLAAEDVRFARTIERIQRTLISELTKLAVVHLASQGIEGADMVDFELNLVNPSTIYEQEKVNLWSEKVRLVSDIQQLNMISKE